MTGSFVNEESKPKRPAGELLREPSPGPPCESEGPFLGEGFTTVKARLSGSPECMCAAASEREAVRDSKKRRQVLERRQGREGRTRLPRRGVWRARRAGVVCCTKTILQLQNARVIELLGPCHHAKVHPCTRTHQPLLHKRACSRAVRFLALAAVLRTVTRERAGVREDRRVGARTCRWFLHAKHVEFPPQLSGVLPSRAPMPSATYTTCVNAR